MSLLWTIDLLIPRGSTRIFSFRYFAHMYPNFIFSTWREDETNLT